MAAAGEALKAAAAPPAAAAAAPAAATAEMAGPHTARTATAAAPHSAGAAPPSSCKLQLQLLGCSWRAKYPEEHPSALPLPSCFLQHLPAATLTQLVCAMDFSAPHHLAALCSLTALRSWEVLPQQRGGPVLTHCSSTVLRPMSALQQLTALKFDRVRSGQFVHLQLLQLQRLVVDIKRAAGLYSARQRQQQQQLGEPVQAAAEQLQLQLAHLMSLSYLECSGTEMLPSDELPASLRALKWSCNRDHSIEEVAVSVQPLLQLSRLQQLDLSFPTSQPAVEEQQQLGSLRQLTAVSIAAHLRGTITGLEQAWAVLPLTRLELVTHTRSVDDEPYMLLPAAALHALSGLTRLEALTLGHDLFDDRTADFAEPFYGDCGLVEATFAQLAAALQPLTALQHLELHYLGLRGDVPSEQHVAAHPAAADQAATGGVPLQQQQQQQPEEEDAAGSTDSSYTSDESDSSDESDLPPEEGRGMFWEWLQSQPARYHSAAGVLALSAAVCSLPCLQGLQLQLPVSLQPGEQQPGQPAELMQRLKQQRQHCRLRKMECSLAACKLSRGCEHLLIVLGGMHA
uniref:Uncharacterized protein n=1 Tax=Tetradesmus obliquus TaxID=3088 RepID=A0A383W6Q0_TETOB|eukprot:jgi/Sobl393_1/14077/SZX72880.1